MGFYEDMAATALDLLTEFGQTVTITRHVHGTYDPATGTVSGDSTTTFTAKGALMPVDNRYIDGKKYEWDDEFDGGTAMTYKDAQAFIAPFASVPLPGDLITFGSITYSVVESKQYMPGGPVVVHELRMRN